MTILFDNKYLHMEKSKYFWLLDAGHGGIVHSSQSIVDGKSTTKPRRILKPELERMGYKGYEELWDTKSFVHESIVNSHQSIVHEGLVNRQVINKLYPQLEKLQIDFGLTNNTPWFHVGVIPISMNIVSMSTFGIVTLTSWIRTRHLNYG